MSGGEFAAIEARAAEPSVEDIDANLMLSGFDPAEKHPEYSHRQLREAYREGWLDASVDIPALLAAVRERDSTIARVRDIVESVHMSDDLDPDGYQVAGLIRAALDPQETP